MLQEMGLFREIEPKRQKIILRLTERQKNRIIEMAKKAGVKSESKFVISLISREHEEQISEALMYAELADIKDVGDDMPF
jgi:uncharacterized protein (DUF1778 family)